MRHEAARAIAATRITGSPVRCEVQLRAPRKDPPSIEAQASKRVGSGIAGTIGLQGPREGKFPNRAESAQRSAWRTRLRIGRLGRG
jgi:hypothetical protein